MFLWSVVTGAKLISLPPPPPSFSSRGGSGPLCLFILPASFPLWLPLLPLTPCRYSPQTITVFTSLHQHSTSLLLSTGKVILTAKPLEKKKGSGESCHHVCDVPLPKHLTQIDFIWHFESKSCTRRKKMYHVIVFFHLSNRRQWQCSRNKSKGKDFSQTYLQPSWIQTYSDVSFIYWDTVMSSDNTDTLRQLHTQILVYLYRKEAPQF